MGRGPVYLAAIYARSVSDSKVRWVHGPVELRQAMLVLDSFVASEALSLEHRFEYFELRGMSQCSTRYRVWIEPPVPRSTRTEVLLPIFPGRKPRSLGGA